MSSSCKPSGMGFPEEGDFPYQKKMEGCWAGKTSGDLRTLAMGHMLPKPGDCPLLSGSPAQETDEGVGAGEDGSGGKLVLPEKVPYHS